MTEPLEFKLVTDRWYSSGGQQKTDDVVVHLLSVAERAATYALMKSSSMDSTEVILSAVSAGLAVETLLKAVIAKTSPTLLASSGHDPSHLFLLGADTTDKMVPSSLNTRGAADCLKLFERLHPGVLTSQVASQVFNTRNAAAHMGIVNDSDLEKSVLNLARVLIAVLPILDLQVEGFLLPDLAAMVLSHVENAVSNLRRRVEAKMLTARRVLHKTSKLVQFEEREQLFSQMERRKPFASGGDGFARRRCPVCERSGWLEYDSVLDLSDSDIDFSGTPTMTIPRWGTPIRFSCMVCELELDGEETTEFDQFQDDFLISYQLLEIEPDSGNWEVVDEVPAGDRIEKPRDQ